MIRAVFFDLDDTLCDAAPAWQATAEVASAMLLARRMGRYRAGTGDRRFARPAPRRLTTR